jgi:tRNA threonylcarbamoyladenosine biosynthesis protein TsaE
MFSIVTGNEDETRKLGEKLGALLQPGDFIALYGDLGSGKTRFAQGVALGAGVDPQIRVTSPTYTILNEYDGKIPVYHFDLYRLGGDADIAELGFDEYFSGNGICLVEWAERLALELPERYLGVHFHHGEGDRRRLEFEFRGEYYKDLLEKLFGTA